MNFHVCCYIYDKIVHLHAVNVDAVLMQTQLCLQFCWKEY